VSKKKRVFKDIKIPTPCKNEVEKYLVEWETLENYASQEISIKKLFVDKFPLNNDIHEVLIKTSVLNDFYSTNIFNTYIMAKHIVSLNIDKRLENCDMDLVDDIAFTDYGNGKTRKEYSFATKYCSHHKPIEYPIYDSFVDKILVYFRDKDNFFEFENDDLKNIQRYFNWLSKVLRA
jgi:hypothetical protein